MLSSDFEKNTNDIIPREYQKEAVRNWAKNNYVGIYVMATGTGKTLTAVLSVIELQKISNSFLTIILCPYVNLVEQWANEMNKNFFEPVLCYSKYSTWKHSLSAKISKMNRGIEKYPIAIISNSSFVLDDTQNLINRSKKDILIIVDEAHYAGSEILARYLDARFKYKLGLTATPQRYFDDLGTESIFNFFEKEVFSFDLKEAIEADFLTPYNYFPIKVYLNNEEFAEYRDFTEKIARIGIKSLDANQKAYKEILLQKRARILQGAANKYNELRKVINNYKESKNILVYCGSVDCTDEDSRNQIENVCKILGNEFGMKIGKYTYEESVDEREKILKMFESQNLLQALVAIKCLDEGIDIPCVETAIIVSSSSNPKEYIQRRGRVLRKFPGKEYSTIIDFIVVPPKVSKLLDTENIVVGILKKELKRVRDFSEIALNMVDSQKFIEDVIDEFGVTIQNGGKNDR